MTRLTLLVLFFLCGILYAEKPEEKEEWKLEKPAIFELNVPRTWVKKTLKPGYEISYESPKFIDYGQNLKIGASANVSAVPMKDHTIEAVKEQIDASIKLNLD